MIHFFKQPISHLELPDKFTYPFHYTPHPLCVLAAEEVKEYIASREEWKEELAFGKMFGVLIVQKENIINAISITNITFRKRGNAYWDEKIRNTRKLCINRRMNG